jgi:integrating conjugative element protein (TIGR03749 family)
MISLNNQRGSQVDYKHNRIKLIIQCCILLIGSCALPSQALVLVWNKTPLNIQIPVAQGKNSKQLMITFPEKVQFGLPSNLQKSLNVQNNYSNNTLYLTAVKKFPVQQVMVKAENGDLILLNLSATDNATDEPITIEFSNALANAKPKNKKPSQSRDYNPVNQLAQIGTSQLVRYAVQQLYAPKRLLHSVRGINQTQTFTGKAYDLISDGSATTMPLYSWSGGGLVVTAILIKNNLDVSLTVSPNMICGGRYAWTVFAPFPQSKILPRGSRFDTTTLFLVSKNSFNTQFDTYCKV